MFVKYPTFAPPNQPPPSLANAPISNVANPAHLTRRLSEAYSPIPIRHHYHHDEPDPPMPISQQNSSQFGQFGQPGSFMRHPQPRPSKSWQRPSAITLAWTVQSELCGCWHQTAVSAKKQPYLVRRSRDYWRFINNDTSLPVGLVFGYSMTGD